MLKVGFGITVLERSQRVGGIDGIGTYANELSHVYSKWNDQLAVYPFTVGLSKFSGQKLDTDTKDTFRFPNFKFSVFSSAITWLPFVGGTKFSTPLDVVHATDHYIPNVGKTPLIATLMDAIPITHPEWTTSNYRSIKNYFWKRTAKWADKIITISEFSKTQISENFNIPKDKITVTPLGVGSLWFQEIPESKIANMIAKYQLKKDFFIFVGTLQPRKNLSLLIESYLSLPDAIKKNIPLIIVGRAGWGCEDLVTKLKLNHFGSSVRWLDHVPFNDLLPLVKLAKALLYPTLYEGFGLPILEAFASKVPVITSNTTSIPEVAGDAAILIDPTDSSSITLGMQKIIEHPTLSSDLIKKGYLRALDYTWEMTAKKTIEAYKQVIMERL